MIYEQCNYSILLLLYNFEWENVEIKQTWNLKLEITGFFTVASWKPLFRQKKRDLHRLLFWTCQGIPVYPMEIAFRVYIC